MERLSSRASRAALALATLGCITATLVAAASGGTATRAGATASVVVDPALAAQLAAAPKRGVGAIVTTWQAAGLDAVEDVGVEGRRLQTLPMLVTRSLTAEQLRALRRVPAVRSVWAHEKLRLYMEDSTWITKARYVWPSSTAPGGPPGLGITGDGVEIAVIDTGIDGTHEDADNLIEFCDATPAVNDGFQVRCTPWNSTYNVGPAGPCGGAPGVCTAVGIPPARGDATDLDVSHGTHVSGTIAGSGDASGGIEFTHSTIGMAPRAKLRVYSANIASSLLNVQTIAAYDDMIRKKEDGYSNVVAVNNSWGGGDGTNYAPANPINVAVKRAYDAGILSVFAASNSGPEHNTLSSQCVNPYVVCVAASTKPDSIVAFSSRGRPSQPSDTNRDGVINSSDVQPDNHDRRLGQALSLGLYRPTLAAPGVTINSMKAIGANIGDPTSAACREEPAGTSPDPPNAGCYVQANGTSMATPHVAGAVALIVQAFRQGHGGRTPTPKEITEILEFSANKAKLPAWDAEEQGAGRLDAYEAVTAARAYPNGMRKPNIGYPTPSYVQGQYPGAPAITTQFKGCTGTASWTARGVESPLLDPVGQPPLATQRYGQHFINVPEKTDRIRVTVTWPKHPTANLYARLWRPGVNPDAESATPDYPNRPPAYHQTRVFPDQEAVGLPIGAPPTRRLAEVRSPEHANAAEGGAPPAIPSGQWVLRVYHRAGGAPTLCGTTQETPPLAERTAFEYDVKLELPRVTHQPSVRIDQPEPGTTVAGRFVEIKGRAGYPPDNQDPPRIGNVGHSWEGVTNWEVPGSTTAVGNDHEDPDPNNPRTILYFHGNPHAPGVAHEASCTGDGRTDVLSAACNGPMLLKSNTLFAGSAASWKGSVVEWTLDGTSPGGDRTIADPNWVWCLAVGPGCPTTELPAPGPTTVGGLMTVEWWAQCGPLCLNSGDWTIRLWADGVRAFEQSVSVSPALPNVPERLRASVVLPTISATQRLTLHVEPVFLIDQFLPFLIYYDSENPCASPLTSGRCDSLVRMPVGASGGGSPAGAGPENVRVTDLPADAPYPAAPETPALRVAWDQQGGAASYEVYRSTDPLQPGTRVFRGAGTACTSPEAPAPEPADAQPGHDRPGLCYTDKGVALRTTYYYRVYSVSSSGQKSAASEIAYGTPTRYDRQVKVKVDRLYGPQYWEYALNEPSPNPTKDEPGTSWTYLWDTLELFPAPWPHPIFARSFTQGIGSKKDQTNVFVPENGGGSTPNCEIKVTNGGWIIAANGDRATFGGNAKSDGLGRASGNEEYQDHGPATNINVKSIVISGIACSQDGKRATIFGLATVNGQGSHKFQIDVTDNGEPGTSDRYRMQLQGPAFYDSGDQQLRGGNVQIH
jgi:serine protease AprX